MKLRYNQLSQHLQQTAELLPVYFVSGDEPLQVNQSVQRIRQAAQQQEFTTREVLNVDAQFNWQSLLQHAQSLSLFSAKTLLELRMPNGKPGTAGSKVLKTYCENPPADKLLLISSGKLESASTKSAWFKAIDNVGVTLQVWPLSLQELPQWIRKQLQVRGMQLSPRAIQLLAEYHEGNLLALAQEIAKLDLLFGKQAISDEQVLQAISGNAQYTIYDAVDSALQADAKRCVRIVEVLQQSATEPVLMLWAISQALRELLQVQHTFKIWPKRRSLLQQALTRLSSAQLTQALSVCAEIDLLCKGIGIGAVWDKLTQVLLLIAGHDLKLRLSNPN
jgi:DNA polymerase-3 subunit delta